MPPREQPSRINTLELRAQIEKKIGPERSERYFFYLAEFLGRKLEKREFDKLCCSAIGVENVSLHNNLLKAVLTNARQATLPPQPAVRNTDKPLKGARRRVSSPRVGNEDGSPQNSPSPTHPTVATVWANGDTFPSSPRKGRSGRDRRFRDRPSPLGPHGRADHSAPQGIVSDEVAVKSSENGDLNSCDLYRPLQRPAGMAEQPEVETDSISLPSLKRQRVKITTPQEQISVDSKAALEAVTVEDGEEVEQVDDKSTIWVESPLQAPLGVPFCPGSVGAARRAPYNGSVSYLTGTLSNRNEGFDNCEFLPDTETLHRRMEQIAAAEGLQGVSTESAKLLNSGLNSFLNRLIKSSIDLRGAKLCHEQGKQAPPKQNLYKLGSGVNGFWPAHSMQVQSTSTLIEAPLKARSRSPLSLLDFKVAMELNPQQLGEDWPLQLEKINSLVSEE